MTVPQATGPKGMTPADTHRVRRRSDGCPHRRSLGGPGTCPTRSGLPRLRLPGSRPGGAEPTTQRPAPAGRGPGAGRRHRLRGPPPQKHHQHNGGHPSPHPRCPGRHRHQHRPRRLRMGFWARPCPAPPSLRQLPTRLGDAETPTREGTDRPPQRLTPGPPPQHAGDPRPPPPSSAKWPTLVSTDRQRCGPTSPHPRTHPPPPTRSTLAFQPHRPNQQESSNRKIRPGSTTGRQRPDLHKHRPEGNSRRS